jgi:hypothetical protein
MNLLGIGSIVETVGNIADNLITTDKERLELELENYKVDAGLLQSQAAVNAAEAAHESVFVAGWRPAIGWVGAAALAYQFLVYPLLVWGWALLQARGWVAATLTPPPMLDTDALWVLLTGMLGIAGMRSFDKVKGKPATAGKPEG